MPINFPCSNCQRTIRVPDGSEGKKTKCPKCQEIQRIPDSASASPPPTPSSPLGDLGGESSSGGDSLWDSLEKDNASSSTGGSSNPFGDSPDSFGGVAPNPYASPSATSSPVSRNSARGKIMGPAIALLVVVGLGMLLFLVQYGVQIADLDNLVADARLDNKAQETGFYIGFFGAGILCLLCGIITIAGMIRALQVRNYGLVMTAFILAMLPCTSSCLCIFALPFSIWGIVVLNDKSVSAAFRLP